MDPQNLHDEEKKKAFQDPQISRRDLDAEPSQQQRAPLAEPEDMDLLGSERTKVKEGTNFTGTSKKTVAAQELVVTEQNKCTSTVDRIKEKVIDSDNSKHKELAVKNSQTYEDKTVIETDTSEADRKQMKTSENAARPVTEEMRMDLLSSERTKVKEGTNLTGTSKKTVAAQELAVTEQNKCTSTVDRIKEKVIDSDNSKHKELAENNSQTYEDKIVIETDTSEADRKQMKTSENAARPVTEEMRVRTTNIPCQSTMSKMNLIDLEKELDRTRDDCNNSIKNENLQIAEGSLSVGHSTEGEASKTSYPQNPKSDMFDKQEKLHEDRILEATVLKENAEMIPIYGAYGGSELKEQLKPNETEKTKSSEIERSHVTEDGSDTKADRYKETLQHHQMGLLVDHLKLISKVKKKFPNVSFEETSEYIELTSSSEKDVTEARNYIDSCLSSLVILKKYVRKPVIMALSKQDVEKFIYQQLEKKGVHCHWVVAKDYNALQVFALSYEKAQTAYNVITENIHTETDIETDIASKLMLKFSGKCFKWTCNSDENKVTLVCTSDIIEELHKGVADEVEKRNQSDISGSEKEDVENSEKFLDNAKSDIVGSGVKEKSMNTDRKSVVVINCPHEIGKLNYLKKPSDVNIKAASSLQMSSKFENTDQSEEIARKFAPRYSLHVDVDECLGKFVMQLNKMEEIRANFNVSISKTSGRIQAEGEDETAVIEVTRRIKNIAKSIFVDYVLKPDPVKECAEEWKAIQVEAAKHDVSIYSRTIRHGPLQKKAHFKVGSTDICVGHGCVSDLNAVDLIVFPVNTSLFPVTVTSYLIYKEGGEKLTEAMHAMVTHYMKHNKGNHPPVGHLQFSKDVGNLPCSSLAYIVVDESYGDEIDEKKLQSKLKHIFEEASRKGQAVVAVPLEISRTFPVQKSSKIVAEAISSSIADSGSYVKNICLCVENERNLELAETVFKYKFEAVDKEDFEMVDIFDRYADETKAELNVEIAIGSVVDQQVDAIVCSTHENFKLKYGVLVNSILDSGGPEIEDELESQSKPPLAEIISTKAGKLNCKRVLFGSLPKYGDEVDYALKNLKLFLRNCFRAAMNDDCKSIAFPLLGTGNLKYPVLMVAREMFRAAHFCATESRVHTVKFVLLENDCEGQAIFSELQKRFQEFQNNQDHQPTGWRYLDVRINSLKTKVSVMERVDREALVSDVIVRTEQKALEGRKKYILTTEEPYPHVLNTKYLIMGFSQSSTDEDFKACLKEALTVIRTKGYEYLTLDFSNGENNYTTLGIDVLKSCNVVTEVQQIKIVSEEKMFGEFLQKHSSSESANVTFTGKIAGKLGFPNLWAAPNVTVSLKQYVPRPHTGVQTSWLAMLYATDPQELQKTRQQIEEHCKRSSSSSVDDDIFISKKPIFSEGTPSEQEKPVSETIMSHTYNNVEAKQSSDLKELSAKTSVKTAPDSDDEDECEIEVFGEVEAILPLETKSKENFQTVADAIAKAGDGSISMRLIGFKPNVKFDFCQRYKIRDLLTSMNDQGIFISKEQSEKNIENVDHDLFKLLLLYIKEHPAETQIKQDFLKWNDNVLQVDCDKKVVDIVKSQINTLKSWNTETVGFAEDKYSEAVSFVEKLKEENPNVIAKLLQNEIQISGTSENTTLAKHKAKIALGIIKTTGRRGRRLDKVYSSLPSRSLYEPTQTAQDVEIDIGKAGAHKQYKTKEGIIVRVYKGNITNLQVDCIVNAANEHLSHGGGVAAAISKAAGPEFQQESSRLVFLHGPLPVTECKETTAFELPYKYVLHAVGPRFSDKSDTNTLDQLSSTVFKVLRRAEELRMKSIALPSISAGIFGGQIVDCAKEYAKGVIKFSRETDRHVLDEIHFVDVQERFVQQIRSEFDIIFSLLNSQLSVSMKACDVSGTDEKITSAFTEETSILSHEKSFVVTQPALELKKEWERNGLENTTNYEKPQSVVWTEDKTHTNLTKQNIDTEAEENFNIADNGKRHLYPSLNKNRTDLALSRGNQRTYAEVASKKQGNPKLEESNTASKQKDLEIQEKDFSNEESFTSQKGVNIYVRKGDIAMLNVDAIVCPENIDCSGDSNIAKAIKSVLGDDSVWKEAKTRNPIPESVLRIHTVHGEPYKYVLLAITPFWQKELNRKEFEQQIRRVIERVFEESNKVASCSIAFPLIGVGGITGDDTTPFQFCCNILCDEILKFANDTSSSSKLKEITIMSLEEGIVFLCKEALTERFNKTITEVKLGTKFKSSSPKFNKMKKCSMCKKVDITCSETCNRCSEQRQKASVVSTEINLPAANHPYATVAHKVVKTHLPGFEKANTILIFYDVAPGFQRVNDPAPGSRYCGTTKCAYLPANSEGWKVFQLFRKALESGLVFKVGRSGFVGWSGLVEHKTYCASSGRWGYPDNTYLSRVERQLGLLGILPDLQPPEYDTLV